MAQETPAPPVELTPEEMLVRVRESRGERYWQSLSELAETPEFQASLKREFPSSQDLFMDSGSRRSFLKVMGASLALSGLTACRVQKPRELILPYVNHPEGQVIGKPMFYASAMPFAGYAYPVLVESHEGRPTKIEGNPDHPSTLGAATAFMQASILGMYDPDRAQSVTNFGRLRTWNDAVAELIRVSANERLTKGRGLRIVTGAVSSPTTLRLLTRLQEEFPEMQWVSYDPINLDMVHEGARLAFGRPLDVRYDFAQADVVVSLDSDFTMAHPYGLKYSKAFSARRRVFSTEDEPCRHYQFESTVSPTGALADHRVRLRPSEVELVARVMAGKLGVPGFPAEELGIATDTRVIEAAVRDLQTAGSKALVAVGEFQPAKVHAIAHAINKHLGAFGTTVAVAQPVLQPRDSMASLRQLTEDMNAGKVSSVIVLNSANPLYTAPGDLGFASAFAKVPFRFAVSEYSDETAASCVWHVPESHYLESWGDARSEDGTISIVQPLISPLFASRTSNEVLAVLVGETGKTPFDLVQDTYKPMVTDEPFEKFWRRALHDGLILGTERPVVNPDLVLDVAALPPAQQAPSLEIAFRPDTAVMDGRFANLGWLQELPRPYTKMTWENAIGMSLATATALGVKAFGETQIVDEVTVTVNGRSVTGAAIVIPGHPDNALTLTLGYGRRRGGRVAVGEKNEPLGYDAYPVVSSANPHQVYSADLKITGKKRQIAQTQLHFNLDDPGITRYAGSMAEHESVSLQRRGIIRTASLTEFRKDPMAVHTEYHTPGPRESLTDGSWQYKGYAWGMAIDTNVCNSCNACVVACQAENNIPVVGKDQVRKQREMHWLRIDQYYMGSVDNPRVFNMPMACVHCENAPCEVVCPVAATVHGDEGTNDMVYNRCVGTRFCANNCPYKVRRFNWFQYTDWTSPLAKMLRNPEVTPRSRGVMEKCTYCIQRIAVGRIEAENDGRKLRDGEVVTACQATCPTDAIVFGNINDPESRVTRLKRLKTNYSLLAELNIRPRTTYLAAIRNPNPNIEEA